MPFNIATEKALLPQINSSEWVQSDYPEVDGEAIGPVRAFFISGLKRIFPQISFCLSFHVRIAAFVNINSIFHLFPLCNLPAKAKQCLFYPPLDQLSFNFGNQFLEPGITIVVHYYCRRPHILLFWRHQFYFTRNRKYFPSLDKYEWFLLHKDYM